MLGGILSKQKEQILQLFIGLSTKKDICMYDCNAHNVYAHAHAQKIMKNLTIGDVYFEWYKGKTRKSLNCRFVLPVNHLLQGHSESGKMWINLFDRS